ncbi:MAG: peptide-methionine (R)-S-oxide reductase MsrB [Deltaproteobacteria bacterium]|nr:peptide-methionine (R)-S-oxide reductase MsrB [Deltaproteobacteria bacterium]MBW2399923.1 peptide-methionine (R)-S-oxide reductase MsrB [Deltaproteobacteria bacterium]MBW2665583.1 peptide-methionine (R)-S-oxide reductase MsrB [Deltaproteobacteria bacterium]
MSDKLAKTDAEWREQLAPEQYAVCREGGTEQPWSGVYNDCKDAGTYRCICCNNELFSSETKFDSGSGWPSFWAAVDDARVHTEVDTSHGMQRTEVRCGRCDAHLGHVFPDGPAPTQQRYCINSVALDLEREEDPG